MKLLVHAYYKAAVAVAAQKTEFRRGKEGLRKIASQLPRDLFAQALFDQPLLYCTSSGFLTRDTGFLLAILPLQKPNCYCFFFLKKRMAPLILHNVPDDELYVGDDGIQRPYAMVFPQCVHPLALFLFVPTSASTATKKKKN
jgi:hypothetical protein